MKRSIHRSPFPIPRSPLTRPPPWIRARCRIHETLDERVDFLPYFDRLHPSVGNRVETIVCSGDLPEHRAERLEKEAMELRSGQWPKTE